MSVEERGFWGGVRDTTNRILDSEYCLHAGVAAIGLGCLAVSGAFEIVQIAHNYDISAVLAPALYYLGIILVGASAAFSAVKFINDNYL